MSGIFALFLHQLQPMHELVDAAVARMRQIPTTSPTVVATSVPTRSSIFLDRAANQARAGARYVREILPSQVEDEALAAGRGR